MPEINDTMDVKELDLLGVIAFDGITRNGLLVHPDGEHLIYPMGSKIVIRNVKSGDQKFLSGHRSMISALCVSSCGKSLASGEENNDGSKAMVALWDYEERRKKVSYEIHKIKVEDVCFSHGGDYLISLGGKDDGSIVVWDVRNGVFVGKESAGKACTISRMILHERNLVTVGEETFKLWYIDSGSRKLHGVELKFGKIRRAINCVAVDERDENAYCGTTSGDILHARLNIGEYVEPVGFATPFKYPIMIGCYSKVSRTAKRIRSTEGELYGGGVRNLLLLREEKMIVGAGDGTLELIEIRTDITMNGTSKRSLVVPRITTHRVGKVWAAVTSMVSYKNEEFVLVGTALCEIYEIQISNFSARLLVTCHTGPIRGLAFPRVCRKIFATAGKDDIRVWNIRTLKELLRITVPNFVCFALCFYRKDQTIISAWNDGAIREFALNGGHLLFILHNAHAKAVSAIAVTNDNSKLVSGGCDGQVRVWDATSENRRLLKVLKEHRGPITSLAISSDDKYLVSSSTDGTCVIWDARTLMRKHALMGNSMYMGACFVPTGVQVLTCGTDRKIAYWETWDGSLVRQVQGSTNGTLNAIDVSPDGRFFVTCSDDFTVSLWEYRTAIVLRLGLAHAAPVIGCAFAPDGRHIFTVSADGAAMLWKHSVDILIGTSIDPSKQSRTNLPSPIASA